MRILKIAFENLNIVDRICAFSSNSFQFRSVPVQYIARERSSDKKKHTISDSGVIVRKRAKSISEESSDKNSFVTWLHFKICDEIKN